MRPILHWTKQFDQKTYTKTHW